MICHAYSSAGQSHYVVCAKPHSIWGVTASWAESAKVSASEICCVATWSTSCTFVKYDRLDLAKKPFGSHIFALVTTRMAGTKTMLHCICTMFSTLVRPSFQVLSMRQTVSTGPGGREGHCCSALLTGWPGICPWRFFPANLWSSFARSCSALIFVLIMGMPLAFRQVPGDSAEQERHTVCCAFSPMDSVFSPD